MTSFQISHPWNLEFGTFDVKGTSVLVLISSDTQNLVSAATRSSVEHFTIRIDFEG